MNPQYLQQSPYHGGQQTNSLYSEENANYPPKSTNDMQSSSPQKPPLGAPLLNNSSHMPQTNQNNLANQMSSMTLSNSQQNYPPSINGAQNQNNYPTPGQPPISGPNVVRNTQINSQGQQYGIQGNQQNVVGPPVLNQQQGIPPQAHPQGPPMPTIPNKQNLPGPPMPGQIPQNSQFGPQTTRPPFPGQTNSTTGPPIPGQPNLPGSIPNAPNLSGPLPAQGFQQNFSAPPMPNQQNLSRPPMPNQQGFQAPAPYQGQQFPPGPPLPGQQNNPYGGNQGFPGQQPSFPGQPPVYGNQPPYQGGMPTGPGGYNAQEQQIRKPNADHMPSPIAVFQDDQKLKGGAFITNQRGLVPPLVTTKFVVQDQGNASPRYIRSSMYTVPTTADIMKQTQIPFALILSPMAEIEEGEYEPPIVDMGEIGPVRCVRCKAYMCPFMQFVDAGRRFQCMFCKATTEVPSEYFQHLDHTGQRMDRYERPELMLGTYEFVATKDYCRNNILPKPPALIFVIDVTYNNIKSGLVNLLCSQMKSIIRNLPVDVGQSKSNMKVGFITYNNTVHFYNCKANLAQPQMLYVSDVQEVFMPLLEGFLCDPEESESVIDSLMTQIPIMFGDTRETETILGPAIQAGLEALKAAECAGKLLVFHSSLPNAEAPGKLKNRDDRNVLGTEKEKTVLAPQTNFYNELGQACVGAGCSVDLFLLNNSYIDVATVGQVSRLSGGEIYKYTYFQADIDGERLITDIINNIRRPIAFDAVMRVRTSTGVRPTDFYGHLFMSNTTDIELASIDCDKAIALEVKHDDKLTDDEGVYIQAALLYTSCSGIRRLRIINLSLKTSSQIAELYRTCDLDAVINFFLKHCINKLVEFSPKAIKDGMNSRCANILAAYRKYCASPSNSGQLILPESMKLLPLYINSLLKSDALTGGAGITVDQKSYVMMAVSSMPITETVAFVYPRLISLKNIDPNDTDIPPLLRCSIDKFEDDGVYLLENGIHMFMWLGLNLNPQWVQAVFGVASVVQVDTDKTSLPILDNSLNKRVREVIAQVQSERRYCMRMTITRQREKMEMVMRQFLVEDRGVDGSLCYVDYICQMHGEIRSLLT